MRSGVSDQNELIVGSSRMGMVRVAISFRLFRDILPLSVVVQRQGAFLQPMRNSRRQEAGQSLLIIMLYSSLFCTTLLAFQI